MGKDKVPIPRGRRAKRADVEKGKVDKQICRIIFEQLDPEGHWRINSDTTLCDELLRLGAVDTHAIRGRDNQMDLIEERLGILEEEGRVFFTESDGVCELSSEEGRRQRIASTQWHREVQQRKEDRHSRRSTERQMAT
ncbi:MAG TPA: hypothetical protein VFS65_02260 [Candidatus Saccharimonadales bacterium]|nr:hypothetical protein [Candidatus Saccharimonadales bacterium]